jgi:hypothetical protein
VQEVEVEPEPETNRKSPGEELANDRIGVIVVERIGPTGATKTVAVSRATSLALTIFEPRSCPSAAGFFVG